MTHHGRPWVYRGLLAVGGLAGLLVVALAFWIAIHGRFDLTTGSRHIAIRRVTPVSLIAWLVFMGLAAALGPPRP